jgi:cellulose synthase/poly-beta-1,6-N-acetylglucosamine synthase-like glycosyltransferase
MIFWLLIVFILLAYAIFMLLPGVLFVLQSSKGKLQRKKTPFITVVVPARNEEESIIACLESLAEQEYPKDAFEVIVADDHSTDGTERLSRAFAKGKAQFRLLESEPGSMGKKQAISHAVKMAKGSLIATTDADSVTGPAWLSQIAAAFDDPAVMLAAGIVVYKRNNSLLRGFLQAEQVSLQLVSAGMAKLGFPVMCSGASLAYRKDFFTRQNGYEGDQYVSGDDMMLLQKAKPSETRFFVSQESLVYTKPASGWGEAVLQRARWVSKFSAYGKGPVAMMAIVVFLANFLPMSCLVLGLTGGFWSYLIAAFCGKTLVDLLLLSLAVPFFREPRLLLYTAFASVFYPLLVISAVVRSLTGKIEWKGRKWDQ